MWIKNGPRMICIDGKNLHIKNLKSKLANVIVTTSTYDSIYDIIDSDEQVVYTGSGSEEDNKTGNDVYKALNYIMKQINLGVQVIDMGAYDEGTVEDASC